jgi:membrane protease YdiL (CAAX protease family)
MKYPIPNHLFQGGSGIITVGFIGLALATIYEWRKNLIAPIAIHFLQNFISIVIAPYLS